MAKTARKYGVQSLKRVQVAVTALGILLGITVAGTSAANAQTYSVLHNFADRQDGGGPQAPLAIDRAGNLYGTTPYGGQFGGNCSTTGCGVVFKLTHQSGGWIYSPLYLFTGGNDGDQPFSGGVTIGPDGSLYGTTLFGAGGCAPYGCGIVFKLTPPATICRSVFCPWTETVLYRFSDSSAGLGNSYGGVVFDSAGNLYGMTAEGGNGSCDCGAIYKLTQSGGSWTPSILYSFTGGSDGASPQSTLTIDRVGNLYGTAPFGGLGNGVVFELVRSGSGWSESTLYEFGGALDGGLPLAGVILDNAGNVYGDTVQGGTEGGGVAFELSRSGGGWTYAVLSNFNGILNGELAFDSAGNLYGTTYGGGAFGGGLIFKLSESGGVWTQTAIYNFTAGTGDSPIGGVTFDASGNYYGTATQGGTFGQGVAWEIMP
jgi:uncharacterized repeat protein (TIGR03803 family)